LIKVAPRKRHQVTFIVGLRCKDGIVLCSDSLETDGLNKKNVKKLFKHEEHGKWGLAFGCSGSTAACTKFGDRLYGLLRKTKSYNRTELETSIEATIAYMRTDYPDERLSAVVGLWNKHPAEIQLYRAISENQCVSIESDYSCAGLDVSLGRFLLDSVFIQDKVSVFEGAYLSTFLTLAMKEKADGVGGPTQMLMYQIGDTKWNDVNLHSLEGQMFPFSELEKEVQRYCWSRFPHQVRK